MEIYISSKKELHHVKAVGFEWHSLYDLLFYEDCQTYRTPFGEVFGYRFGDRMLLFDADSILPGVPKVTDKDARDFNGRACGGFAGLPEEIQDAADDLKDFGFSERDIIKIYNQKIAFELITKTLKDNGLCLY